MSLHGLNLIAGRRERGTGHPFEAVCPLDSSTLSGLFHGADEMTVNTAMEAAGKAFAVFRETSGAIRASLLEAIANEILALGETLIDRAHRETGLPPERITGERARTVGQLRLFAEMARSESWRDARIDTADPARQPLPKPDVRRMLAPIGPVVVFGSSNFPLAFSVAGGDTASALATGNPVVVKAHSAHPGTSELVGEAILRAVESLGLPGGIFSLLHGSGRVIGQKLAQHPSTRAIGFTGSLAAGRALMDTAAARPDPIPVFAEMSSLNPLIVFPSALRERGPAIATAICGSVTLGCGQFCTKPGLIFAIAGDGLNAFEEVLAAEFSKAAPKTMLHPGIVTSYRELSEQVASVKGVASVAESAQPAIESANQGTPRIVKTTAANFLAHQDQIAHEVFGPFAVLIVAESFSELETAIGALNGQLTASLFADSTDATAVGSLLNQITERAGRVVFNAVPTGVEVCRSMHHGGPWPATSDVRFTSVGTGALLRFVRPLCFQNAPQDFLPEPLQDANPLGILRLVNGAWRQDGISTSRI